MGGNPDGLRGAVRDNHDDDQHNDEAAECDHGSDT